jgi:tetratricopeptide (TPR) repeat protein
MRLGARLSACLLAGVFSLAAADPASFVLARRAPDGSISFEVLEDFTVSGRDRIRLWTGEGESITEREYKDSREIPLSRASVVRADGKGRLIHLEGDPPIRSYVLSDGAKLKGSVSLDDFYSRMSLLAVKSKKAKQSAVVPPAEFFALLPAANPPASAVAFVLRDANFYSLEEQLRAMEGAVRSFPGAPEIDSLQEFLARRLSNGLSAFEAGGPYKDFLVIVKYAGLAHSAFPSDARLQSLCTAVTGRKDATVRSMARLTSLANNRAWDTFLETYTAFEPFQSSFPQLIALRTRALQESARLHAQRAFELAARKKYPQALAEYRVAVRRDPDNELITQNRERVLHDYNESQKEARAAARKPLPADSMELRLFHRHLEFAAQYTANKQFDEALREIEKAAELDRDAPEVLLGRAELFFERGELASALPLLNEFDRTAADARLKTRGETLRNRILFERSTKKPEYKKQLAALIQAGSYSKAHELARTALKLDQNDGDFNYYAGAASAVLRRNGEAKTALGKYLDLSVSLRGDLKRRDQVRHILALVSEEPPATASGARNWLSGKQLPEGVYYCPESLAFQPHIAAVEGYKMTTAFTWMPDGRLESIVNKFQDDKGERNFKEMASRFPAAVAGQEFYFIYHPGYPQVLKVVTERPAADVLSAPLEVRLVRSEDSGQRLVDAAKSPLILLESNPSLNPRVLALLDGPVTVGVAGNSFFNPFIWDGIHYFRFDYDRLGRVETAREIGTDLVTRFDWDGERLTSLRVFRGESGPPIYSRTLTYSAALLASEAVEYQGKGYRIEYSYDGTRLLAAEFEDEGAHDGRRWRVRFQ